ncbi:cysteine/glutathione ABC transporter permease/ATP-binding protein CydD [Allofrancisella guangzhouensis]|uniref:Cysteine ABC transporter ATP-binding protein n=1 Tax=Allofrancisella guangzhouensis TaxID=594679 RepID=A0A0A8E5G8_9GAMM|nr:cysteine/glutathione ABC transporter permease/ATP-binding protein CydD [Allofrancisella guangzhouensis]AJC49194.1 cysteine ABC transporter ATP-binding protein [Allofrancisella guangzhouensis]MBK2027329.1 cysteine/glutathione ABC transporter permease/ATP-binding protein CydD [Allofrancisella guangzhouensis]MBK2043713.1 cysteine/glutathione ABC transporter permease/ATP-binding protein CydD [Allofrancisella guangzhouensis]MBK2045305.1 cysteine/glutathione ABC transporter permease/ATP-binding pr
MQSSAVSKQDKKSARKWLNEISLPAKLWIKLTVIISFVSGLLLIGQLYLLAHISYDAYLQKQSFDQLKIYFFVIVIIVVFRASLSWLREIVSYKAAIIVKKQLREDIIAHINKLGPIGVSQTSNANIISSAMEQVEGLTGFLTKFLPQVTSSGLLPLAILAFIFPQSFVAGIILLICAPLIPLFMVIVGLGAESESQKHFKSLTRMSLIFLDTLKGLTTLKLFNKSKSQSDKIFQASDSYRIRTMKVLKIAFLSSAVLELFAAASIALVAIYLGMGFINAGAGNNIWWSLHNLNLQGALFILLLAPEFFMPLRELSTHYHAKAEAVGAAVEIAKIFDMQPHSQTKDIELVDTIKTIDIQNLTVKYGDRIAIDNISLGIHNKQKIAIVGASGAGKTTLINTILGFIGYQGNIIINGSIELKEIQEKSWLKNISWLGQNASLFKGSIKDNLTLANNKASDKELAKAIDQASLGNFMKSLPNGLETQIGEQNLGVSGGQAQRLALARAYLKPHNLLILDEPTASLDKDTETKVIESLKSNWQDKTVIMLTHKLSFLECVDKIYVLDNGKLIQQGTFKELVEKESGEFYNFYKNEVTI